MNSSAITNSVMPTVSIPGSTAQESKGSGFGDVMNSITDSWSERNVQIKYDAAKSAQSTLNDSRADRAADRNVKNSDDGDYARSDDRNDDRSLRDKHDERDDHAKIDEPKSDDRRDIAENRHDTDDTQHAESDQPSDNGSNPREETASSSDEESQSTVAQNEEAEDSTLIAQGIADPNQPMTTVAVPGSVQVAGQVKVTAAPTQSVQGAATNTPQANLPQSNVPQTNGQPTTAAADDLMGSTALSQPVAASSAKMALNGVDATTTDDASSDKFLSRIVESMSADGKARADATGVTSTTTNNASATSPQQTTVTNPAQTAQQAMAATTGLPVQQTNVASAGQSNAGAVSATGSSDATAPAQAGNGQLNTTSHLHQTNTGGQSAQTARQAPAQQVQQQVAVSIKNAASDGVDKISVQLRPEHLGRVDVKLEIGHDGRIQGVIQADTRETLDMLRQDSRALQQALRDAGLNADSQSFTFEHRDQGGRGQEGQSQSRMTANQGSSPSDGDILSGAELAEHVGIGYGINPNGLVDIRI